MRKWWRNWSPKRFQTERMNGTNFLAQFKGSYSQLLVNLWRRFRTECRHSSANSTDKVSTADSETISWSSESPTTAKVSTDATRKIRVNGITNSSIVYCQSSKNVENLIGRTTTVGFHDWPVKSCSVYRRTKTRGWKQFILDVLHLVPCAAVCASCRLATNRPWNIKRSTSHGDSLEVAGPIFKTRRKPTHCSTIRVPLHPAMTNFCTKINGSSTVGLARCTLTGYSRLSGIAPLCASTSLLLTTRKLQPSTKPSRAWTFQPRTFTIWITLDWNCRRRRTLTMKHMLLYLFYFLYHMISAVLVTTINGGGSNTRQIDLELIKI